MYIVYALYSPQYEKIYIGYTSDLPQRMQSHNFLSRKGYTSKYRPWELVYQEQYEEKVTAMLREKQLKSARGREFIWSLIRSKN